MGCGRCSECSGVAACITQSRDGCREEKLDSSWWAVGEGEGVLDLPAVDGCQLSQCDKSDDLDIAHVSPRTF